jgi:hypothetical protein
MDLKIDVSAMRSMVGRTDVYRALLDAMKETRGPNESQQVMKLRLQRALQGRDLTVHLARSGDRVPAELSFIGRTVAEVHPSPRIVVDAADAAGGAPVAAEAA